MLYGILEMLYLLDWGEIIGISIRKHLDDMGIV